MTDRIQRYLKENDVETPILIMDLDAVEQNYRQLRDYLPLARIFYAVKANPAPQVVDRAWSSSAPASTPPRRGEIELCMSQGVTAGQHLLRQHHQEGKGHRLGLWPRRAPVRLRQRGRAAEARQGRARARGCSAASWSTATAPSGRCRSKFGCAPEMARDLLIQAQEARASSRTACPSMSARSRPTWSSGTAPWAAPRSSSSPCGEDGVELKMINLGGGFPARYRTEVAGVKEYASAIMRAMTKHFGNDLPRDHHRARPLDGGRCRRASRARSC